MRGMSHAFRTKRAATARSLAWLVRLGLGLGCLGPAALRAQTTTHAARPAFQAAVGYPANWQERLTNHAGPHETAELAMLLSFPDLHDVVLNHTFHAFRRARWPAARLVLNVIIDSELRSHASDASIAESDRALISVMTALRLTPEACRQASFSSLTGDAFPPASAEIRRFNEAAWLEAGSGYGLRKAGGPRVILSQVQAGQVLHQARLGPDPLTVLQATAVDHARNNEVSALDVCEGELKLLRNETSRGIAAIGALSRELSRETGAIDAVLFLQPAIQPAAPPDFICPPVGTRIKLSDHDRWGRPVQHLMLGRRNWDCHIQSSVTGDRDFRFSDAKTDFPGRNIPDWLPALWPFAVGKAVHNEYHPAIGDSQEEDDVVTRYAPRVIGKGLVPVYEITQDVRIDGGRAHYRVIDEWAPTIGYQVAHRTVVLHGQRPEDDSPDWVMTVIAYPKPERAL